MQYKHFNSKHRSKGLRTLFLFYGQKSYLKWQFFLFLWWQIEITGIFFQSNDKCTHSKRCVFFSKISWFGDFEFLLMATIVKMWKIAIAFFCYTRKRGFRSYAEVAPSLPYFWWYLVSYVLPQAVCSSESICIISRFDLII